MRINSLYISAFGGLKDKKLDLQKGLNVIYGENEKGKSTIMAFIKMMFYGSDRGSSQISKNIRKKYTPWDGSPMAGYIDFYYNNKNYRLEREFRSSNSTDRVTLCDMDLGERQSVSPDIGLKFLGLTSAAFERSLFIGQLGFPEGDTAAEGEINSKLSNIALTGDEDVSFETVYSRVEKEKLRLMSKSGKAGEYDKNVKEAAAVKSSLDKAVSEQELISKKKAEIKALQSENALLEESLKALKLKIDAEQDIRNAQKLKELLSLKEELDSLNETLRLNDGSAIDEMYLTKLKFCISKCSAAKGKSEAKAGEVETLRKSIEKGLNPPENASEESADELRNEIDKLNFELSNDKTKALENELTALKNRKNKKSNFSLLLIMGAICPVLGIALKLITDSLSAASLLCGIGLILIIAAVILSSVRKSEGLKAERDLKILEDKISHSIKLRESIEREIFRKKVQLEAINTALNTTAAVIENQRKMLSEAELSLNELDEAYESEREILTELYRKYKPSADLDNIEEDLAEISRITSAQKEIKQKISFYLKDLNGISYEEADKKLKTMSQSPSGEIDFEELKLQYDSAYNNFNNNKMALAGLSAEIKTMEKDAQNPEELKAKLKVLGKSILSQKDFCDTADIVLKVLSESFGEVRRSYGSVLEKNSAEIFKNITNGKYEGMSISKSFQIGVNESNAFGNREIAYLSSGTADQAYLALRLAVARLICEKEALPILLDDALTQYDDARLIKALEFLKEYSKDFQVIMFTCHKNIAEEFERLGEKYKEL